MRIGIQTWGSEGDIRPFLALGAALVRRGHEVRLAYAGMDHPEHGRICERFGIVLHSVASGTSDAELRLAEVLHACIHEIDDPLEQLIALLNEGFLPYEADLDTAAQELCEVSDLVIGHYVCQHLAVQAQLRGIPQVTVSLSPGLLPSGYDPAPRTPNLGPWLNRVVWRVADWVVTRKLSPFFNPGRERHGLPPIRSVFREAWCSSSLHLVAVSPVFHPPRPDWPEHVRSVGSLDLPGATLEWQPSAELEAFLGRNPPPVFFTFGSMTPRRSDELRATLELLSEAARLAGCTALIHLGPDIPTDLPVPDGTLLLGRAPFDCVMPRCRAVVHHGGAGTLQTACRAGRPQVIVAHMGDQEPWARAAHRAGIAPAPLLRRTLTAGDLASRLKEAISSEAIASDARTVAETLAAESDGSDLAAQVIESWPRAVP